MFRKKKKTKKNYCIKSSVAIFGKRKGGRERERAMHKRKEKRMDLKRKARKGEKNG